LAAKCNAVWPSKKEFFFFFCNYYFFFFVSLYLRTLVPLARLGAKGQQDFDRKHVSPLGRNVQRSVLAFFVRMKRILLPFFILRTYPCLVQRRARHQELPHHLALPCPSGPIERISSPLCCLRF